MSFDLQVAANFKNSPNSFRGICVRPGSELSNQLREDIKKVANDHFF